MSGGCFRIASDIVGIFPDSSCLEPEAVGYLWMRPLPMEADGLALFQAEAVFCDGTTHPLAPSGGNLEIRRGGF